MSQKANGKRAALEDSKRAGVARVRAAVGRDSLRSSSVLSGQGGSSIRGVVPGRTASVIAHQQDLETEDEVDLILTEYLKGKGRVLDGCEVSIQVPSMTVSEPSMFKSSESSEFQKSLVPAQKGQRLRGACFTINNYTEKDEARLRTLVDQKQCTYLVFGREVGKKGTPHLQGYAHFTQQRSLKQINEMIGGRAHIEYARADGEKFQMRWEYCMKDGDFEEFGVRPQHGGQLKKATVFDLIKEGRSYSEIRAEMPQAVFHNRKKLEDWFDDERKLNPSVVTPTIYYRIDAFEYDNPYEAVKILFQNITGEIAYVTNLAELERYVNLSGHIDNICYIHPQDIGQVQGWPYGVKMMYKHGYQYREFTCKRMIIYSHSLTDEKFHQYSRISHPKDIMELPSSMTDDWLEADK